MSAAHMLAHRGFEVSVYDFNNTYVGGKARSVEIPGTDVDCDDKPLPGEHGFRFFPGFYKHVTATMKEIPCGNGRTAFDNLVTTDTVQLSQIGECPITLPLHRPSTLKGVRKFIEAFKDISEDLTRPEMEFFAKRVWQLMTSCKERFLGEYERQGWWCFTHAEKFSKDYQELLVNGITRSLVAADAREASTRTIGTMFLQLLYTMGDSGKNDTDMVLNAPTNDAWLTPWSGYLESLGVRFHKGYEVKSLSTESGDPGSPINEAVVQKTGDGSQLESIEADHFVLAVPVEVAARILDASPDVLSADPELGKIKELSPNVEWMNGVQYFLDRDFKRHRGHTVYAGSNWALTSISQLQFWPEYDLSQCFCGKAKGILSVDISDWEKPGNFNGKRAMDCSREEVIEEAWKQLEQEVNGCGEELLNRDMVVFAYLDSAIYQPFSEEKKCELKEHVEVEGDDHVAVRRLENREPLLVNLVDTWKLRPESETAIPNLTIAADYARTFIDLACMEGADEAARRATNHILKQCGSREKPCKLSRPRQPWWLKIFQWYDKWRWSRGLPWKNGPFGETEEEICNIVPDT